MATPDQIPSDLTLEISENLSPDRFMAAARAFFGYIEEVGKSASPDGSSPNWVVRLREGSQLIGVDPVSSVPLEVVKAVYARVDRDIAQLASGDMDEAGLSEPALKHLRTLSEFAEGVRGKPVAMRLWVCKQPKQLEPIIAKTIREDWKADYNDFGTIEGRLEAIQDHGNLQLRIRDALLRQTVRCYIPDEMLKDALGNFRKRVEVHGNIHYRKNGTPISIEVSKIDPLPDDDDLPGINDVRGILRMSA